MTINPCGKPDNTFGKFQSNAIGDPYIEPNHYQMRRGDNPGIRTRSTVGGTVGHNKPFGSGGAGVQRRMDNSFGKFTSNAIGDNYSNKQMQPHRDDGKKTVGTGSGVGGKTGGFLNSKHPSSFQKDAYVEDPYERKQDLAREEYAKNNGKIIHRDQPFSNVVRQRGCFYPTFSTYGSSIAFPDKKISGKQPPLFGPFKHGDPAHVGHNKAIGGHGRSSEDQYMEEVEEDTVKYQKNVQKPIWKDPTNALTMMNATVINNMRNVNKERSVVFGK